MPDRVVNRQFPDHIATGFSVYQGRMTYLLSTEPKQHLPGAAKFVQLGEDQFDRLLNTSIWIFLDLATLRPPIAHRQCKLQFTAASLLSNSLLATLPEKVKLEFTHRSLESQQQPVI